VSAGVPAAPVKLAPPDAVGLLVRQRLHDLADAHRGGVLWVSSPAGGGKSSFVSTWCRALPGRDVRVRWLHVDAGDADPATLFAWLARGLGDDARAATLPAWSMEQGADPVRFAQRFFRAYADAVEPGTVLVLDNVHDAADSPLFCALLGELVRAKRDDMTLVLTSRHVPADALLPITAHPRFATIAWPDLRCTDDEAHELARAWGLPAPAPQVLALADGWVSALVIMLRYPELLPAGTPDLPNPARVFASLAGAAFDALPDEHRHVLMLGAFAPRFDPAAIEAASGLHDIGVILDDVWSRHFFLERRVDEAGRTVYAGHPLLRAFLRERARSAWEGAALDERVRRLALHFAQAGDLDAAAQTHEAAGAWPEVAPLVLMQCPRWMQEGRVATIADWLRKFDAVEGDALDAFRPALDGWQGTLLALRGDVAALEWLERAHRGHLERGDPVQALLAVAARMDAYFLLWEQMSTVRTWADELERLFDLVEHALPRPLLVRVLACGANVMFPCVDHPVVARFAAMAQGIVTTTEDPHEQVALAGFVIGYSSWMGRLRQVREAAAIAALAMDKARLPPSLAIQTALWVAVSAYCDGWASDPRVRGFVDRAFELMERHDLRVWAFHCWIQRTAEATGMNDVAMAARANERTRALNPGSGVARQLLLMGELWVLNCAGAWQSAIDCAQTALAGSPNLGGFVFGTLNVRLQLAAALTMLGRDAASIDDVLQEPAHMADRMDSDYLRVMVGLTRAAVHLRDADVAACDLELQRALSIANAAGFRHLHPTWSKSLFQPPLARALEAGIETEWVSTLLRVQRVPPPPDAFVGWPSRIRIRVLGAFDLLVDERSLVQGTKGKAPTRVFELLSHLALHGHEPVPVAGIADALWPDAPGDSGALEITLHRARKLLDDPEAIVQSAGTLRLNPERVGIDLVDALAWARRLEQAAPLTGVDSRRLERWRDELLACVGGAPRGYAQAPSSTPPSTLSCARLARELPRAIQAFHETLTHAGMASESRQLARTLADRAA
jgi:hypothetical protein